MAPGEGGLSPFSPKLLEKSLVQARQRPHLEQGSLGSLLHGRSE